VVAAVNGRKWSVTRGARELASSGLRVAAAGIGRSHIVVAVLLISRRLPFVACEMNYSPHSPRPRRKTRAARVLLDKDAVLAFDSVAAFSASSLLCTLRKRAACPKPEWQEASRVRLRLAPHAR